MLFEMHQYDIKICHYYMAVFAVSNRPALAISSINYKFNCFLFTCQFTGSYSCRWKKNDISRTLPVDSIDDATDEEYNQSKSAGKSHVNN